MEQLDFFDQGSEPETGPETPEIQEDVSVESLGAVSRSPEIVFGPPVNPDDDCPHNDTYRNCPFCRFRFPFKKPRKAA
ncbi:MAG: hypothetical protein WC640_01330 [Candidatus Paceibacterota bacterium]